MAYEIGLQEATVFYSGHSPEVSSMALYASSWLIGASSFELVPGVDCPATAAFIDTYHFVDGDSPRRYRNSICAFELNMGLPLRRHYTYDTDGGFRYYGGTTANCLVLRTIAAIWNKDYIFDYVFYLDGSLEIKVATTGYLQTTFALPRERPFGYHVHNEVIGNIHQDLFHFKIDVDVGGSANRYEKLTFHEKAEPNFWFPSINTTKMYYRETLVETERESIWDLEHSHLQHHIILNHKLANR